MSGAMPIAANPATKASVQQSVTGKLPVRCVTRGIRVSKEQISLGGTGCTDADKEALSKLTWAEGNLKSTGSDNYDWASTQWDYGYYYKFNMLYDGTSGDPCSKLKTEVYGTGWRTPSKSEMEALTRCTNKASVPLQGKKGMWFMTSEPSGLFLPAAGYRSTGIGDSPTNRANVSGDYWSSYSMSGKMWYLRASDGECIFQSDNNVGRSVRCVRD